MRTNEGYQAASPKLHTCAQMVEQMQKDLSKRLREYAGFLEVKTKHNVTASVLRNYPGMTHFLYVDRNRDSLICPSLGADSTGQGSWRCAGGVGGTWAVIRTPMVRAEFAALDETFQQQLWRFYLRAQQLLAQVVCRGCQNRAVPSD